MKLTTVKIQVNPGDKVTIVGPDGRKFTSGKVVRCLGGCVELELGGQSGVQLSEAEADMLNRMQTNVVYVHEIKEPRKFKVAANLKRLGLAEIEKATDFEDCHLCAVSLA